MSACVKERDKVRETEYLRNVHIKETLFVNN